MVKIEGEEEMLRKLFTASIIIAVFTGYGVSQQVQDNPSKLQGYQVQSEQPTETPDKDTAEQLVYTILLDDFERAGEWHAEIPIDFGTALAMRREGCPKQLQKLGDKNRYVLGVKFQFVRRGFAWATIMPPKEIKIPGITKSISLWVVGRNYKHTLKIIIRDLLGRLQYLTVGRLTHTGWKLMIVNIPDTVIQDNYKVSEDRGISFVGLVIEFDPEDISTRKPFYVYFDYLTAKSDLFVERFQNPDDMVDNW